MSEALVLFEGIAHSLIFSQKTSNSLRKEMSEFPALDGTYSIHSSTVFVHCPKNNLNPALKSSLSWLKFYHFNTFGTLERKMSFKNP